ncbi:alpha-amylase (plasmid) [Legionella adelaidensis]|uniref:Alpha-amylase n=1 Tax=Legionella adelaidensis TaxID=45056 RepID=A0A0W0R4G1_9GAMM|nr:alpha-amylase family protein [Legionella adelaidensis]KTC65969.1 alpha-amylase [Legionella adelaidensis]VEH86293.1 alpha-amylase [Legionella adelaidensis]
MSPPFPPTYPHNGNLRLYNMFPMLSYVPGPPGIDGMIAYVEQVAGMGYNAIWVNPLQLPGTRIQPHPGHSYPVTRSLYAMADDTEYHPVLFQRYPTKEACEGKIREFTQVARSKGIFPLFDLVLNHIGLNEEGLTPLQKRLAERNLLSNEVNIRWPDIQDIDYYLPGSKRRGLDATREDIDERKVDEVFSLLWEPFITHYIVDLGFMGARIDAITRIPLPILRRALALIHKLVEKTYGTQPIIVAELMGRNSSAYIEALSMCGLTHCFNSYSYFWSPDIEGGYAPLPDSPYLCQQQLTSSIVLSSPKKIEHFKVQILSAPYDVSRHNQVSTIYIYEKDARLYFVVNGTRAQLRFDDLKAYTFEEDNPSTGALKALCREYACCARPERPAVLEKITTLLYDNNSINVALNSLSKQLNAGGAIAITGNHDVGTLRAKVILDIAFSIAAKKGTASIEVYNLLKGSKIKALRSEEEWIGILREDFNLSSKDIEELYHQLPVRMREKLFIEILTSSGGWYSLAGDEFGICRKPDVFIPLVESEIPSGPSLFEIEALPETDKLKGFIRGINDILSELPKVEYSEIENTKIFFYEGDSINSQLFFVLRFSNALNKYFLFGYSANEFALQKMIPRAKEILGASHPCFLPGNYAYSISHAGVVEKKEICLAPRVFKALSVFADSTPDSDSDTGCAAAVASGPH